MSTPSQAINVHAVLVAQAEYVQQLETAMRTLVQASRAEAGVVRYDLLRHDQPDGAAEFHVQERYIDLAAVQAHRDSPHYQTFRSAIGPWLAQPPRVTQLSDVDVAAPV